MLRVEGELNAGYEETVAVWMMRWGDVDDIMKSMGILKGRGDGQIRRKSGEREHTATPAALYQDSTTVPTAATTSFSIFYSQELVVEIA